MRAFGYHEIKLPDKKYLKLVPPSAKKVFFLLTIKGLVFCPYLICLDVKLLEISILVPSKVRRGQYTVWWRCLLLTGNKLYSCSYCSPCCDYYAGNKSKSTRRLLRNVRKLNRRPPCVCVQLGGEILYVRFLYRDTFK